MRAGELMSAKLMLAKTIAMFCLRELEMAMPVPGDTHPLGVPGAMSGNPDEVIV